MAGQTAGCIQLAGAFFGENSLHQARGFSSSEMELASSGLGIPVKTSCTLLRENQEVGLPLPSSQWSLRMPSPGPYFEEITTPIKGC
jgi:hypothetical protein